VPMVLHNLPAGDFLAGDRGIACHPGREGEFRDSLDVAIRYAQLLGCRQLNCLAGKVPVGVDKAQAQAILVHNLRLAAPILQNAGIRLLVEPINPSDMPGFVLNTPSQADALLDTVGSDNLFIQYDIYHAQRTEGELAATIQRLLPRIGHMQLADNPGRHEPGTGEINFPWLLRHIDAIGYTGWIGCEYVPVADTLAGLEWRDCMTT